MNLKTLCEPTIGDKVKLKDYSGWCDYIRHAGEIGTIIGFTTVKPFYFVIEWKNTGKSYVEKSNVILQ